MTAITVRDAHDALDYMTAPFPSGLGMAPEATLTSSLLSLEQTLFCSSLSVWATSLTSFADLAWTLDELLSELVARRRAFIEVLEKAHQIVGGPARTRDGQLRWLRREIPR